MFLPLRLLYVVVILFFSNCTSTAMPMVKPETPKDESPLENIPVKLWRSHNGEMLDPKTEITPCSAEDKLRGCVISPEEWQISVDGLYYGVVQEGYRLKATSTKHPKGTIDASKGLLLGTVSFPYMWRKVRFLDDLHKVEVGGRFEYSDSVVKKMRNSHYATCQWKSDKEDEYSTTWDAMYKKVEVPI
ncbi:hypothetical protein F5879DRAFT_267822 [Lentinula edodes]|nr:hypothetical protein F5879DRAFT_267822 [Lentinula edodes]